MASFAPSSGQMGASSPLMTSSDWKTSFSVLGRQGVR
jgi:hypothetical protein